MKKRLLTISLVLCALSSAAQVNTAGLVSEAPGDPQPVYIVSHNGYFLTTKGSEVTTTTTAPAKPEWVISATDGGYTITNSRRQLGFSDDGNLLAFDENTVTWTISSENTAAEGRYSIASNVYLAFYDLVSYVAITVSDEGAVYHYPGDWEMDPAEDGMTRDLLFFHDLPAQIDNREVNPGGGEGGGEEGGEEVDVPENNIEGDFLANWELGMQDAKVLTMVPMKSDKIHNVHWNCARSGVTEYSAAIFQKDIVERFYGNRAKNLYFVLPPNGVKVEYFIKDATLTGMDEGILWSQTFDYSATTDYLLKQKNGTKDVNVDGSAYGKEFNLDLLKGTDYDYYTPGELTAIPCDYTFTDEHPYLMIGYKVLYPGKYEDNYINGKNPNAGIKEGTWFKSSSLLATSITSGAFIMGNDDPDVYGGRPIPYEDYTGYQSILLSQYRWCDNAGLLCYVETEGEGGFPHSDIRFDEVKVTRCYTDDAKVPFKATFTNYGVDPILSAAFDVNVGDKTTRLNFKDGIGFLEQAALDEDITPPATPSRMPMNVVIAKINGKEVNIPSSVNGSIIAVNYDDDTSRMPVIEENTGTWCGWCPRGLVGMEKLREKYGEDVALIGIHTGADVRANGMMDEVLGTFGATGAPTCLVNRIYLTDPYYGTSNSKFGIARDAQKVADLITEASVSIKGVALNTDKTQLAALSSTTFSIDAETSPYRLTYVITEDGQIYQQMSYYITQTSAADKENYRQTDPDLYALTQKTQPWKPVINDIMEYCSEPMGIEGTIPAPIVKGQPIKHKEIITLPKTSKGESYISKLANCRLIALLIDTESLEIVNAAQVKLDKVPVVDSFDTDFSGIDTVLAPSSAATTTYDFSGRPVTADAPRFNALPLIEAGRKVIR